MVEDPRFCPACGAPTEVRRIKAGEPPRAVCSQCGRVHYTGPKLAAGVIGTLGDRILLVRRAIEPGRGKWVYPGGFVDLGESPERAAVREAREEAGVEVEIESLVGVFHSESRPVVVVVYSGSIVGGQPAPGDEALETRFFSTGVNSDHPGEDIPWESLAFETTRRALESFLRKFKEI